MNVYFDGSYTTKLLGGKRVDPHVRLLSYGVVIDSDTYEGHELYGCIVAGLLGSGLHEVYAFCEAVLWLSSHDVDPADVTFIADDQTVVYGAQSIGAGWARNGHQEQLFEALEKLAKRKFMPATIKETVLPYLLGSRFIKVKGHDVCINNNRCDYLARYAVQRHLDPRRHIRPYVNWLNTAYVDWDHEKQVRTQVPAPFIEGVLQ